MRPIVAGHGAAARIAASLTAALLTVALLAGLPARSYAEPITSALPKRSPAGSPWSASRVSWQRRSGPTKSMSKAGCSGRPVKLVFYDNQSSASNVPGIYTKLLDVDHVDLIVSGYSTNMTAPAMPIAMGDNKLFVSLFCLAVNTEFHYPRYFSMLPTGPDPKHAFSRGFFDLAVAQSPQPQTVAIVAADADSPATPRTARGTTQRRWGCGSFTTALSADHDRLQSAGGTRGARDQSRRDLRRVIPSRHCRHLLRAANEIGLKTQLFGGGMVGVNHCDQNSTRALLNGIVVNENWVPAPTIQSPAVLEFLTRYQGKAQSRRRRSAGYFLPPWAYARMQMLAQAIEGDQSIDDGKLAEFFSGHTFKTIIGDVAFGKDANGLASHRLDPVPEHQRQDLAQFKDPATEVVVLPARVQIRRAHLSIRGRKTVVRRNEDGGTHDLHARSPHLRRTCAVAATCSPSGAAVFSPAPRHSPRPARGPTTAAPHRIDVHHHIVPPPWLAAAQAGRAGQPAAVGLDAAALDREHG